ncbi:hypothetical protein N8J89_19220 [Crossiella sp. CA-258035]|uniref:hypothetical protein n=1 Tax=Crossiella sp. CA-258035 TaxID=2981138 RepID=UPI0024BC3515|nr:hypothetical protein [Crossiella sp. CA-258035]WHT23122.1 hypothetical protein N8J89_19220 [Crossiella sp. CA-258035]
MKRSTHRWSALAATTAITGTLLSPVALAAPGSASRVERRVETALPDQVGDGVLVSRVDLRSPLPPAVGPRPEACEWISYLRYRPTGGPADPQRADSVFVEQPGSFGSADNSDSLARNTVRSALGKGQRVEFWAQARRPNCLTDNTGLRAGWAARDWRVAFDYYYQGKVIGGRKFEGFKKDSELGFLAEIGVEQTVRDQYDLMLHELPDSEFRRTRTVCGGASMAGLMTGFFAAWDFDGDPATTADAGYRQCGAFFGLDTLVTSDPVGLQTNPLLKWAANLVVGKTHDVAVRLLRSGVLPRSLVSVPGVNAELFNALGIIGIGAHFEPGAETDLHRRLPANPVTDTALRLLFARSYVDFLSGANDIREFRFTNAALLGTLMDNNTANLGILQVGLGAYTGGPVAPKTFPLPGQVSGLPLVGDWLATVTGPNPRVGPTDKKALYGWRNHDNVQGVDYTSPGHEVTSLPDLARQFGNPGINSWEYYHSVRTLVDFGLALAGSRDGELVNLRHAAAAKAKPTLIIGATDSAIGAPLKLFFPKGTTLAPGYTHIDTLTASYRQNTGRPEHISDLLSTFAATQTRD